MALVKIPSGPMYCNFYQFVLSDKVKAMNMSITKLLSFDKMSKSHQIFSGLS